jgi:hypothetical protein
MGQRLQSLFGEFLSHLAAASRLVNDGRAVLQGAGGL